MTGHIAVGLEEVQRATFQRLFARFIKLRAVVGPIAFTTLLGLLVNDPSAWRVWVLTSVSGLAVIRVAMEYVRFRREGFQEHRIPVLMIWVGPLFVGSMVATGGLSSPVFPLILPVTFFTALFLNGRAIVIGTVVLSSTVWFLLWLALKGPIEDLVPAAIGGGRYAARVDSYAFWQAGVYQFALLWASLLGYTMRSAYREMVERALQARDEVLALQSESTRTLTTLSGEIAHELKNPLASVKGLAALVDGELSGKAKDRMTVLRREVDRMQEILDSFLNFSRPLVPLDAKPVRLRVLCEDVAALHEGQAFERSVSLRILEETPVEVRAEPRKVKQILINLVQNALDASPKGGVVGLVIRRKGEGGFVEVRDQGPGMPAEELERVFEPGVTSKSTGSGLGLTIARALARQHGGEVTLARGAAGGTTAELFLPGAPP